MPAVERRASRVRGKLQRRDSGRGHHCPAHRARITLDRDRGDTLNQLGRVIERVFYSGSVIPKRSARALLAALTSANGSGAL